MAKKGIREKKSKKRSIAAMILVTAFIAICFLAAFFRMRMESEEVRAKREAIEASIAYESVRAEILAEADGRVLTDEEIIQIAKEKFGLVFPYEILLLPKEE